MAIRPIQSGFGQLGMLDKFRAVFCARGLVALPVVWVKVAVHEGQLGFFKQTGHLLVGQQHIDRDQPSSGYAVAGFAL